MGYFEKVALEGSETDQHNVERSICLHAFSDLSHVPAATFVCLLKDCYAYGMPSKKMLILGLTHSLCIFIHVII
jgi:hypothetical protein